MALYGLLNARFGTPIIELNRAVAISMAEGPTRGLRLVDSLSARGELHDYYLLYAAEADLLRRLHQYPEARINYQKAICLTRNSAEKKFLESRLQRLPD